MKTALAFAALLLTSCQLVVDFEDVPEAGAQCTDGVDNDTDGATDCADSGCAGERACTPGCGNGVIDPPRFAFNATAITIAAPVGLAVAQIGGDGSPDVAVAARGGAVSELRVTGGTLVPQTPITVGRSATLAGIAAAPFNGSGTGPADALVIDGTLDEITHVVNGGTGFSDAFLALMLIDPQQVLAADLDDDEDIDAFVCTAGVATYLRNQSGDGFAAQQPQLPESPSNAVAADLDGDGRNDLVLLVAASDHLIVLTQNPSGGTTGFPFVAAPAIAVGDNPVAAVVANLDGAGRPDLAVATAAGVQLLRATASGFAAPAAVSTANARALVAADLDGDGDVDLAAALAGGGVAILANDGAGAFTLAHTEATGEAAAIVALRVDADPLPDLVVAETSANRVTLLSNATVRETCDDGNTTDGDGCPADCTQP